MLLLIKKLDIIRTIIKEIPRLFSLAIALTVTSITSALKKDILIKKSSFYGLYTVYYLNIIGS